MHCNAEPDAPSTPRTLGRTEFRHFADVLGLDGDDLSPVERGRLVPPWLTSELIMTAASREKLQSWAATHARSWTSPDPVEVLTRQTFVGDELLAHIVARLISEKLPPPVAHYLTERVTFVATGLRVLGFCAPHIQFRPRPWVIVLAYTPQPDDEAALCRFEDLVAHEAAHAWTLPEPASGQVAASAFWMETVHELLKCTGFIGERFV
jgi:hypothetical protein